VNARWCKGDLDGGARVVDECARQGCCLAVKVMMPRECCVVLSCLVVSCLDDGKAGAMHQAGGSRVEAVGGGPAVKRS